MEGKATDVHFFDICICERIVREFLQSFEARGFIKPSFIERQHLDRAGQRQHLDRPRRRLEKYRSEKYQAEEQHSCRGLRGDRERRERRGRNPGEATPPQWCRSAAGQEWHLERTEGAGEERRTRQSRRGRRERAREARSLHVRGQMVGETRSPSAEREHLDDTPVHIHNRTFFYSTTYNHTHTHHKPHKPHTNTHHLDGEMGAKTSSHRPSIR